MNKTTKAGLVAIGLFSLVAVGVPGLAEANSHHRNNSENRAELRRDLGELQRDRADLNGLYRSRASRSDIANKRAEIRQDLSEIRQDRNALGGNNYGRFGNYNNYGRYDRFDRNDRNGGWWNRGSQRDARFDGWRWR